MKVGGLAGRRSRRTSIPDEESEAGLEGRAGGARVSTRVGGRVKKVKLEDAMAGESRKSGSKARLEG